MYFLFGFGRFKLLLNRSRWCWLRCISQVRHVDTAATTTKNNNNKKASIADANSKKVAAMHALIAEACNRCFFFLTPTAVRVAR
ncbi:unnamed protein product, partial [Ceratitis capitata]